MNADEMFAQARLARTLLKEARRMRSPRLAKDAADALRFLGTLFKTGEVHEAANRHDDAIKAELEFGPDGERGRWAFALTRALADRTLKAVFEAAEAADGCFAS